MIIFLIGLLVYIGLSKEEQKKLETPTEEITFEDNQVEQVLQTTTDTKDIEALKEENSDIYAWITIPGTTIDYPILQSEEDNFYLEHKVDKTEGLPGAVYTNKIDGKNFAKANSIVYGHNMKDGSYFGQLHLYEDEYFFDNNREVYIYLSDKKLTYEIFMASKFKDIYLSEAYLMENAVGVQQFLDDLRTFAIEDESSHLAQDCSMGDWNQIVTLSTCVKGENEERYLVVARLVTVELYG